MDSVQQGYRKRWLDPESLLFANYKLRIDGCWDWQRYVGANGYGHVASDYWGKYYNVSSAHRLSYIVFKGDFDRKLWVLHKCHNRKCINPDHLYLGTPKQNTEDMISANRCNSPKGARNGNSKLDELEVSHIKRMLMNGLSVKWLAYSTWNPLRRGAL